MLCLGMGDALSGYGWCGLWMCVMFCLGICDDFLVMRMGVSGYVWCRVWVYVMLLLVMFKDACVWVFVMLCLGMCDVASGYV